MLFIIQKNDFFCLFNDKDILVKQYNNIELAQTKKELIESKINQYKDNVISKNDLKKFIMNEHLFCNMEALINGTPLSDI